VQILSTRRLWPVLAASSLFAGCASDTGPTALDANPDSDQPTQDVLAAWLSIDLAEPPSYAAVAYPAHYDAQTLGRDNTPATNPVTDAGASLGRVLFHDTDLSLNRTTSCASCHVQAQGFSDPDQFSTGFEGGLTGAHSMRLANATFYEGDDMFWDRRATDLEDQVLQPVVDGTEMGFTDVAGGISALILRLEATPYYPILFEWAYGTDDVTEARLRAALAQYVRSIVSVGSRFDDAAAAAPNLGAPFASFSAEENLGKTLFLRPPDQGGAGCAGCHVPPTFALEGASRSNGLDLGETILFKAPSLKNVAVGAPFMHDGRFETLEAVIDHYDSGVRQGPALDRRLEASPGVPAVLGLSLAEKAALVAFLRTLTDTALLTDERFTDPFRN